jgi:hypothetical protein
MLNFSTPVHTYQTLNKKCIFNLVTSERNNVNVTELADTRCKSLSLISLPEDKWHRGSSLECLPHHDGNFVK